jgi:pyruvate-ferredoxin/flavodoxin oxidoreductase
MHSKSAPKYGSEKSGAPTNYYITLSPEPIKITNAELEDVEIVISPDHKVFSHTNPLRGLAKGGTFILQTSASAEEVWQELPARARKTIRDNKIDFLIVDAFAVAKKHAPTPELEIRMMGIAFIGAIAGHVTRVSAGASEDVILEKIRQQISKKFGGKGGDVVVGNMAVIREGIEATRKVDYESAAFAGIDAKPATIPIRSVALSASMCASSGTSACGGLFDREYYDDMIASQFREGTISEAPVLPGTGLFMPAGTAAAKDKGLFRRTVPVFNAEECTGCMECTVVCPDGAIPNTVHDIGELLQTAIRQIDVDAAQREALQERVPALVAAVYEIYRQSKKPRPLHEIVADAASNLETDNVAVLRDFGKVAEVLAAYPVAKSRLFFELMEKEHPGSGGLYSVNVDPWKCTGCQECVDVCGPGALVTRDQDAALLESIQARFEFFSKTPNTPARFTEDAIKPGGKIKYLLLDRANYYATTGGHGACRGCGEVTAIRLVMSTNRAITDRRKREHIRDLEGLIGCLNIKQATLADRDSERRLRIGKIIAKLEKRLYYYESGPTGNGPCGAVIANSTGCSSVYASSFPFNCYNDPWVNSLFQDAQPLAKGIFEGISAHTAGDVQALRMARLELDDAYEPEKHDAVLRHLQWNQFTVEELGLMPTVMTIGGDGATYDIGFGALSRILVTDTPIKVLVLNTGVYSNTGGQASTASFLGQDSDLSRIGTNYPGKHEHRKEFGLLASFHPNVFVVSTSTALQNHFLKNTMEFLNYTDSPAVIDVYTPCQPEHGIADDASDSHARLAVRSRMNPVFVHDPRRGNTLHDWFVLDGNPDPDKTWTTMSLEYKDPEGKLKKLQMTLTPAHFAYGENRFKKHFRRLDENDDNVMPIEDFINLSKNDRKGHTAYIWTTDTDQRLVRLSVSGVVIELVEERRKYWQMLQYLGGQNVAARDAAHRASMDAIQAEYKKLVDSRDSTLDMIARAMSELGAVKLPMPTLAPAPAPTSAEPLVAYAMEDRHKCTNCKICYQDLSELFEKTKIEVEGISKDVGQLIPGVLDRVETTPDLKLRIRRVAASCEGGIIH